VSDQAASETARTNAILGALPQDVWARMSADFTHVQLNVADRLHLIGVAYPSVFFPTRGVISAVAIMEEGESVEAATTGPEGMTPVEALLKSETALSHQLVQVSGEAFTIPTAAFWKWHQDEESFRDILASYFQAFLIQSLQSVACNAVHSTEERMARWLLTCHDRARADSFNLTQQFLSEMLGVTRPAVNTIARAFNRAGLIDYTRGDININDRRGLERVACECYSVIREAYRLRSLSV
jgi:CRP-like cAMP-binding protein